MLEAVKNTDIFDELYKDSAFTIYGCSGNMYEWAVKLNHVFVQTDVGRVEKFYTFVGAQMNEKYQLQGKKKYKDDLNFLAFKRNNLNLKKLSKIKDKLGAKWFNDIVDNNKKSWMWF